MVWRLRRSFPCAADPPALGPPPIPCLSHASSIWRPRGSRPPFHSFWPGAPSHGRKARILSLAAAAAPLALAPVRAPAQGGSFRPRRFLTSPSREPAGPCTRARGTRKNNNNDSIPVEPGETVTLFADHEGAGCVHRFWVTISPRLDVAILSQVVIRMYWDGDKYPSVECPIGAFFGVGFGEQKDYTSLPLNENSGGYNCYWPMPFHKAAHWTLTNGSNKPLESFYYNIDFTALDSLPPATRHFHAQFRRENPTTPGRNYTILETTGEGHYVGTALFMTGLTMEFLEGNEMVYIDGETKPSIEGTGTEDYFSSGWYFDRGLYSAPYHGVVIKDEKHPRISAYRWHVEDAIPFTKSIRFTIEHGAEDKVPADYSSVAYYYLAGPAPRPNPLPADPAAVAPGNSPISTPSWARSRRRTCRPRPRRLTGDSGAMTWSPRTTASSGPTAPCFPGTPASKNAELVLQVPCHADGTYHLVARMVCGPDAGSFQFMLDGKAVGGPVDLYSPALAPREVSIGTFDLKAGPFPVSLRITGRNPASTGSTIGIDAFLLKPTE